MKSSWFPIEATLTKVFTICVTVVAYKRHDPEKVVSLACSKQDTLRNLDPRIVPKEALKAIVSAGISSHSIFRNANLKSVSGLTRFKF